MGDSPDIVDDDPIWCGLDQKNAGIDPLWMLIFIRFLIIFGQYSRVHDSREELFYYPLKLR